MPTCRRGKENGGDWGGGGGEGAGAAEKHVKAVDNEAPGRPAQRKCSTAVWHTTGASSQSVWQRWQRAALHCTGRAALAAASPPVASPHQAACRGKPLKHHTATRWMNRMVPAKSRHFLARCTCRQLKESGANQAQVVGGPERQVATAALRSLRPSGRERLENRQGTVFPAFLEIRCACLPDKHMPGSIEFHNTRPASPAHAQA